MLQPPWHEIELEVLQTLAELSILYEKYYILGYETSKQPKQPRMVLGTLLGALLGRSRGVTGGYGTLLGRSW